MLSGAKIEETTPLADQLSDEEILTVFAADVLPETRNRSEINAALPALYDELRRLAAAYLRRERPDHTLQPTALVHESYLRLARQHKVDWGNRLQFLSIAARMMRRILANYAVARAAHKRGSGATKVELDFILDLYDERNINLPALDEALRDLERMDPRQARVVELRFFAGMTFEEIAESIGVSVRTAKREWETARRWLRRELAAAAA